MSENIITVYDNNNHKKEYKILLIIEREYYYIIYTDLNNNSIKNNLYAIKITSLDNTNSIPINDNEWHMLEKEYSNLINNRA